MPTLNLPKKSHKPVRNETENRKTRQSYYNTTEWRKLRETYIKQNPLCEECLKKGKVTPASSVHHIKSPFNKGEVNKVLFLDYNNLQSICHECHGIIHAKEQWHKPIEDIIKDLDSLLNDNT